MKFISLASAREETLRHLMSYRAERQAASLHGRGVRTRAQLARWVQAIEQVYAMYRQTAPERAHAMERLFGLNHAVPRGSTNRSRMIRLAMDCNVSESTMYKWRDEIIMATMLAAAQFGVLELMTPVCPQKNED